VHLYVYLYLYLCDSSYDYSSRGSEYKRLNVSLVTVDEPILDEQQQQEGGGRDRDSVGDRDRDREGAERGSSEVNDPDLLSAVMSAAEREAEPWLTRLREWGQANKPGLVRVLAPLWFLAVLLLVHRPGAGALLAFTAFSVLFGSLFAPFEPVHPPPSGDEK
jgi:hypothetical protein